MKRFVAKKCRYPHSLSLTSFQQTCCLSSSFNNDPNLDVSVGGGTMISNTSSTTTTTTTNQISDDESTEIVPHRRSSSRGGKQYRQQLQSQSGVTSYPAPPDPSTFPTWAYEARPYFHFEILHESKKSLARVGRIHTPHGIIDTPSYVAVATNGAIKGVDFRTVDNTGQQLVFCNTYHLLLQPGADVVQGAGGLHNFVGRTDRPFITDSGGFQVFSLAYGSVYEELSSEGELKRASGKKKNKQGKSEDNPSSQFQPHTPPPVKVTEEGVLFRSYRDGKQFLLTPESTVQAQKSIGADIIIPLDELPPYHIDPMALLDSVERTHRWEARSLIEHLINVNQQAMYCVIHGGLDRELRKRSMDYLTSLPFDGYAIGGSLGKNKDELQQLLEYIMPMMNENVIGSNVERKSKPRHLLGIADEPSVLGAVRNGIDTMDSCYPTRLSRHGTLLTREGKVHIKSGRYSRQFGIPIDDECSCSTCRNHDRAYLWHLFKAKEPVFMTLATIHNLQYMNDLMARQRQLILEDKI